MTASYEPPSPGIRRIAQFGYAYVRDFMETLVLGGGLPTSSRRTDGSAPAFPYESVLRLTFGLSRAEELARAPKIETRKLAPKPFDEAFDEAPDAAATKSFALSVFGFAGVALIAAAVIGAAICIDMQRLQPPQAKTPVNQQQQQQQNSQQLEQEQQQQRQSRQEFLGQQEQRPIDAQEQLRQERRLEGLPPGDPPQSGASNSFKR
jgi:hypothetical protein